MGLADQLQQGLAGIGAYILCLLGLLLGPSGLLGGVFGPLLALINLALLFVGGIQLIMVNPACTLLESCHERQGPNVISSFVWFCVFAALASTALGPAQVAIQLNTVDDVLDASVCDWRAWGDTGGGVYFNDGTTKIPGKESSFHLPVNLTVEHCEWLSVRWYPCQLYVEPVLRCGEPTSSCKDVCAWAISPESDRINFKGCRQGDGNLCGIALSLMRLTQGKCAGPDARDRFCQRANQELGGLLDDLAKKSVGHHELGWFGLQQRPWRDGSACVDGGSSGGEDLLGPMGLDFCAVEHYLSPGTLAGSLLRCVVELR